MDQGWSGLFRGLPSAGLGDSLLETGIIEGRGPERADEEGWRALQAEAVGLRQVLLNLLTNAIDATPDGGTITVSAALAPATDGTRAQRLELAVSDSGHGMSEVERRQAFEPFYTTKAPGRGTGLGLVIVDHIVHAHGGTIAVDSVPDRGTTVRVQLPLEV
jgi:signal transduction histidine kinase